MWFALGTAGKGGDRGGEGACLEAGYGGLRTQQGEPGSRDLVGTWMCTDTFWKPGLGRAVHLHLSDHGTRRRRGSPAPRLPQTTSQTTLAVSTGGAWCNLLMSLSLISALHLFILFEVCKRINCF